MRVDDAYNPRYFTIMSMISEQMLEKFVGVHYRMADNWFEHVDVNQYNNRPINYLEIGAFYGANLSVAKTYGHSDSSLHCIDHGLIMMNILNTKMNNRLYMTHL